MAKEVYNLQVPIDLDLAKTLRELADEDDRTLRAYCKRILQDHVKSIGKATQNISAKTDLKTETKEVVVEKEVKVESETDNPVKIKKVGKLINK